MKKTNIPIRGMHCPSCEILIGKALSKIKGVEHADVNYKDGTATILHTRDISPEAIQTAIQSCGYQIGENAKHPWCSRNVSDYIDVFIAVIIVFALYYFLKSSGLLNFSVSSNGEISYWFILLIGLTAGFSTCMALVGGLVLGISARHAEKHPEQTGWKKFEPHLYFNLGRVVGFAFLGGVIGFLGSGLKLSNTVLALMTIFVGAVMLLLGIKLIEIFPRLSRLTLTLPTSIAKKLGFHQKDGGEDKTAFGAGALTFFLPCGFTQAMQLYALSTGKFTTAAIVMGLFALGTTPGLLGIGGLASFLKGQSAKLFFKVAGVVVLLLGIFNIQNGWNLGGFGLSSFAQGTSVSSENVKTDLQQTITMTADSSGYSPNEFTIQQGKAVKWVINDTDPFSCSSSLVVPQLGISKGLKGGENIIEFIAAQTGDIRFSCSMGMYRGVFHVVANDGNPTSASQAASNNTLPPSPTPAIAQGASCGGGGGGCGCGGARKAPQPQQGSVEPSSPSVNEQVIKTSYTLNSDIQPNTFTVKNGIPVRFEVDVKEDGQGCMSTIMIPGLYNNPAYLQQGNTIVMSFTPTKLGEYPITCAMGVPRGTLKVVE